MTWRFPPMAPGELNVDPFEGEFFATEALESLADPLVREAIQNSLDAGATDGPVEVRFLLGKADGATRDRYLEGLWPHVEAALGPLAQLPERGTPLTYLAVEDRGTRGLEGDPEQYEDTGEGDERNDFYYFWRNVGRSRKESTDRGRWGLGKTVFAAASRLQAFFGLTVRASDARAFYMGQAVLKIHRVSGKRAPTATSGPIARKAIPNQVHRRHSAPRRPEGGAPEPVTDGGGERGSVHTPIA